MAETAFRSLSLDDRRYALNFAADRSGRRACPSEQGGMLADDLLLEDREPFEALIERCAGIEARANRARGGGSAG